MLLETTKDMDNAVIALSKEFNCSFNRVITRTINNHKAIVIENYMIGQPIEASWIKGFVCLYQKGNDLIIEF